MIRNLIFDWSGTLVDDLPAVWKATNHVFRLAGIEELTLDRFRAEFCLPFKGFYDRYTPHVPLPQLEEWFHAQYKQVQDSVVELPHAGDFLRLCRARGVRAFVLSSVHRDHFAKQCALTGFQPFFERHYIEVLDKRTKIVELLAENALNPAETLFVGDMQHDIDTAKQGGVFSCAVLTGYSGLAQLRQSQPDLIVEHLGELREILNQNGWELNDTRSRKLAGPQAQPTVTVGALIFNEGGQVLMIRTHKWSGLWGIPGGKTKYGETSVEALVREVKEETDLDVVDIRFVLVQDCIHSDEFYRDAHFVLLNYTCRCQAVPGVRLNAEAQEFRWVTVDEALSMALNRPTRTLINAVQRLAPASAKSGPSP